MKKSLGAQTLAIPTPVWVIGSYGENGQANIMTAAWGGICASVPPCVAVSLQKPRASHANILQHKAFTVNIPSAKQAEAADYAGIVSGKNADKFLAAGLTAVRSDLVDAPYVGEFPLILECRLLQTVELGSHTQFIGEIVDVKADEVALSDSGSLALEKVSPLVFSPSDRAYFGIGQRLGTAFSMGAALKK